MKARHVSAERTNARMILREMNAGIGQDFFSLKRSQLDTLEDHAHFARYQKPKGANGSRLRYFYQLVQRRAQRED